MHSYGGIYVSVTHAHMHARMSAVTVDLPAVCSTKKSALRRRETERASTVHPRDFRSNNNRVFSRPRGRPFVTRLGLRITSAISLGVQTSRISRLPPLRALRERREYRTTCSSGCSVALYTVGFSERERRTTFHIVRKQR